jgi:O-antigen/teichoic acid export membrane protein
MSIIKRVFKNTSYLYIKMGITMFISLYSTRLILNALGASDFGIFNIVGGAISMLGFFNVAMTGSTQRFILNAEGEGDSVKLKKIFNISIILHLLIGLLICIILLIGGYLYFNGILNIPSDRIFAAKIIYGSLIVSTFFSIITVPYEAILNTHENMLFFAITGIIESFLKLFAAWTVIKFSGDKLILYVILMTLITLFTLTVTSFYCHNKYQECAINIRKYWDKQLSKNIINFAWWKLLGAASGMSTQYGLGIVLNIFFGPLLNAVQGIANQISGQLMAFSNTMLKSVYPIISKNEASGNKLLMLNATMISSKYSFFILAFFTFPFILETHFALNIWLGKTPEGSVTFTRLQLIRSVLEQLTLLLGVTITANGNIKSFTKVNSILNILPLFFAFVFFYLNFPPYFLYIGWIFSGSLLNGYNLVFFAKKNCGLNYYDFWIKVLKPCLFTSLLMLSLGILPLLIFDSSFARLLIVILSTTIGLIISLLLFLDKEEKKWLGRFQERLKTNFKIV